MLSPTIELEGTWDEIQNKMPDFDGKRLHVTVRIADGRAVPKAGLVDAALLSIWQATPDSAWESLPDDYGDNLDHYLYGVPKSA